MNNPNLNYKTIEGATYYIINIQLRLLWLNHCAYEIHKRKNIDSSYCQ